MASAAKVYYPHEFYGNETENIDDFLCDFEDFSKLVKWNEEEMKILPKLSLKGIAKMWLTGNLTSTYTELKEGLQNRFVR